MIFPSLQTEGFIFPQSMPFQTKWFQYKTISTILCVFVRISPIQSNQSDSISHFCIIHNKFRVFVRTRNTYIWIPDDGAK